MELQEIHGTFTLLKKRSILVNWYNDKNDALWKKNLETSETYLLQYLIMSLVVLKKFWVNIPLQQAKYNQRVFMSKTLTEKHQADHIPKTGKKVVWNQEDQKRHWKNCKAFLYKWNFKIWENHITYFFTFTYYNDYSKFEACAKRITQPPSFYLLKKTATLFFTINTIKKYSR